MDMTGEWTASHRAMTLPTLMYSNEMLWHRQEKHRLHTVVLDGCGCGGCSNCSSIDLVISCTARSGQTDVAQRITDDDSTRNSTTNTVTAHSSALSKLCLSNVCSIAV